MEESSNHNEKCEDDCKSGKVNSSSGLVEKSSKEKTNISTCTRWGSLQRIRKTILLAFLMCMVVVVLQIPTILYFTEPSSVEVSLLDTVDLESCSVSSELCAKS